MQRTFHTADGKWITLEEADPEQAMRMAHRDYYMMDAPDVSLFDELMDLGVDHRQNMREVNSTHDLRFT